MANPLRSYMLFDPVKYTLHNPGIWSLLYCIATVSKVVLSLVGSFGPCAAAGGARKQRAAAEVQGCHNGTAERGIDMPYICMSFLTRQKFMFIGVEFSSVL